MFGDPTHGGYISRRRRPFPAVELQTPALDAGPRPALCLLVAVSPC